MRSLPVKHLILCISISTHDLRFDSAGLLARFKAFHGVDEELLSAITPCSSPQLQCWSRASRISSTSDQVYAVVRGRAAFDPGLAGP